MVDMDAFEEKLNQSQLARALGISRQAVHKLIAAQKLVPDAEGKMTLAHAKEAIAASVHPGAKSAQLGNDLPHDFHEARFLTEIETWHLKRIEREKKEAVYLVLTYANCNCNYNRITFKITTLKIIHYTLKLHGNYCIIESIIIVKVKKVTANCYVHLRYYRDAAIILL